MDDIKAKQQIIEKIKSSANILVTVSNDPSVDALSAALGLTLLLDKLEKHATAVFSGSVPSAMEFLDPEKTFDTTTDSLRDFIIALDKEKADHLRYKVEGDSVKIFITPYKTTITSDDLEFTQGDFNVELVIALGVDDQDHLDGALESHGQILHDATIITVTAGDKTSSLGGIDWHDTQASSLSEMMTGLAEAMKTDKTKSLLDQQISTALLTGIVAETDRFSNSLTTARVMTTAAQLIAAGADQQLIAMKLQESHEIGNLSMKNEEKSRDTEVIDDASVKSAKDSISISHDNNETLEQLDKRVKAKHNDAPETNAYEEQADTTPAQTPADVHVSSAYAMDDTVEPTLGGTLNATSEQAASDTRKELASDQNKTILSHAYLGGSTSSFPETPSSSATDTTPDLSNAAPGASSVNDTAAGPGIILHSAYASEPDPVAVATPVEAPMPAPAPILEPITPAPADLGLPMPPAIPDFSQQLPPIPTPAAPVMPVPDTQYAAAPQPALLGDILTQEPVAPVQPPVIEPIAPVAPPAPGPTDPGQFRIPGQQ